MNITLTEIKDQYRFCNAGSSERKSLSDGRNGKAVGSDFAESFTDLNRTVAVGVRFNNCHDLCILTDSFHYFFCIVANLVKVDFKIHSVKIVKIIAQKRHLLVYNFN